MPINIQLEININCNQLHRKISTQAWQNLSNYWLIPSPSVFTIWICNDVQISCPSVRDSVISSNYETVLRAAAPLRLDSYVVWDDATFYLLSHHHKVVRTSMASGVLHTRRRHDPRRTWVEWTPWSPSPLEGVLWTIYTATKIGWNVFQLVGGHFLFIFTVFSNWSQPDISHRIGIGRTHRFSVWSWQWQHARLSDLFLLFLALCCTLLELIKFSSKNQLLQGRPACFDNLPVEGNIMAAAPGCERLTLNSQSGRISS